MNLDKMAWMDKVTIVYCKSESFSSSFITSNSLLAFFNGSPLN